MTRKDVARAVKALGLTFAAVDDEFRVNFAKRPGMSHDREATAYYTTDLTDAFRTAAAMAAAGERR